MIKGLTKYNLINKFVFLNDLIQSPQKFAFVDKKDH